MFSDHSAIQHRPIQFQYYLFYSLGDLIFNFQHRFYRICCKVLSYIIHASMFFLYGQLWELVFAVPQLFVTMIKEWQVYQSYRSQNIQENCSKQAENKLEYFFYCFLTSRQTVFLSKIWCSFWLRKRELLLSCNQLVCQGFSGKKTNIPVILFLTYTFMYVCILYIYM